MKFTNKYAIICCLLAVVFGMIGEVTTIDFIGLFGKGGKGKTQLLLHKFEILSPITDIAVSDRVYIAYASKRLVQCYTLEGRYLHTIYLPKGGGGNIEFVKTQNGVYIVTRGNNFYKLANGEVIDYLKYSDENYESVWGARLPENQKQIAENGKVYILKDQGIWVENTVGEKEKIITRPLWVLIFNPMFFITIVAICILVAVIMEVVHIRGIKLT